MGAENVDEFSAAHAGPEALQAFIEPLAPTIRTISPTDIAAAFGDLVDDVDRGAIDAALAAYLAASDHEGLREGYWGWFDDDMAFI